MLLATLGCRPSTAEATPVTEPVLEKAPRYELVTDKDLAIMPELEKPEPLEPYTDPAFGTRVTRISSAGPGQVVKPPYNTIQSWNADESLLMLYHTGEGGAGHHLYDGKTYAYKGALAILPRDLEEVYWDVSDPDIFYYVSLETATCGRFIRYHVATAEREPIGDFSGVCEEDGVPKGGNDPQMMSWNSDLLGLRCP